MIEPMKPTPGSIWIKFTDPRSKRCYVFDSEGKWVGPMSFDEALKMSRTVLGEDAS